MVSAQRGPGEGTGKTSQRLPPALRGDGAELSGHHARRATGAPGSQLVGQGLGTEWGRAEGGSADHAEQTRPRGDPNSLGFSL